MHPDPHKSSPSRSEQTRQALLQTATRAFAESGFEAVSTRRLSEEADVNQALIAYHFGSKRGLYLAVFEQIRDSLRENMAPVLVPLERLAGRSAYTPAERLACREGLERALDTLLLLLISPKTEHWARHILREQAAPTDAFTILYEGFMQPTLALLVALVRCVRPSMKRREARILVIRLIGQALVWRAGRESTLRLLEVDTLSNDMIAAIRRSLREGIQAQLPVEGEQP